MKPTFLVFDFDGTIADSFNFVLAISNRLAHEFQFKQIKSGEIELLKDKSLRETIGYLRVPVRKIPRILSRARRELCQDILSVQPIDGLTEAIHALKTCGYKMGIISSNSMENVKKFLKHHHMDVFEFVKTSSKIWGKSHSINKLIDQYKLDFKDVIYIGDEVRDIEAAKKSGIRVAAVTWGYNSRKALKAHRPDFLLCQPEELFKTFAPFKTIQDP